VENLTMEIKFTRIFKIDRENQITTEETFTNAEHVNNYIIELLQRLSEEEGQRLYKFDDSSTTVKDRIEELFSYDYSDLNEITESKITQICDFLSQRLLSKEIEAQERYGHLGHDIQKGMLIFTFLKITDTNYKIIISKSDYDKFIEEMTGDLKEGLPQKKKIYKSFIVNVDEIEGDLTIDKILTYDSNRVVSAYWWKEFLELIPLTSDEDNTIHAFDEIEKKLLNPILGRSKGDYTQLWNLTLAYFRSDGDFDFDFYKTEIIEKYNPINDNLKKSFIKERIDNISETKKFDNIFPKVKGILNKRMKKTIALTPEIDMIIKHDITNIDTTILGVEYEGEKYLMIKTQAGYQYAPNKLTLND
jgi:hypothetical protein